MSNSWDKEIFQSAPKIAKSDSFWQFWNSWNTVFLKKVGSSLFGPYIQANVIMKFSYFTFSTVKFPDLSLKIDSSIISTARFLLKKMATPLAWDVKLEKFAFPPHSALTVGSISADSLVSDIKIMLGFFLSQCLEDFGPFWIFSYWVWIKGQNFDFWGWGCAIIIDYFFFLILIKMLILIFPLKKLTTINTIFTTLQTTNTIFLRPLPGGHWSS